MHQDPKGQETTNDKEIDIGVFFSLIGRFFQRFWNAIVAIFVFFFNTILGIIIFLKRKLLWLLIGLAIGIAFSIYVYYAGGPQYSSDLMLRTNYESSRLLYSKIDYLNALKANKQTDTLARILNISNEQAKNIVSFKIRPVDNELQKAALYKEFFLPGKRSGYNTYNFFRDTAWSKTIKFSEFKEQLTPYDYPFHIITLFSKDPTLYSNISNGIVNLMETNKALNAINNNTKALYKEQEELIKRSLNGLDSLRMAYNKRIEAETIKGKEEGTGILLSDKQLRNPEIDIYDKELMLKDELVDIKTSAIGQQDIVEVYSDFNNVGTRVSIKNQLNSIITFLPLIIIFTILVLIEFAKFLSRQEKNKFTRPAK